MGSHFCDNPLSIGASIRTEALFEAEELGEVDLELVSEQFSQFGRGYLPMSKVTKSVV
jgi:hypothetical protein